MSFATANNFLVAPVEHTASGQTGEEIKAWLKTFNGLAGEFEGQFMRAILSPPYVRLLEYRADLINRPCPGSSFRVNRCFTSIQINCSTLSMQLAGTAGHTHQDAADDLVAFSVSFNASVLRSNTRIGLFLFPTLGCAVPLTLGAIMLFSGGEFHSGMPLMPDADDISEVPHENKEETKLNLILYPRLGIFNGRVERSTPTTLEDHPDQRNPTSYNLHKHSRVAFGFDNTCQAWRYVPTHSRLAPSHDWVSPLVTGSVIEWAGPFGSIARFDPSILLAEFKSGSRDIVLEAAICRNKTYDADNGE
ncbi:MAG: hypothetical protein M1816_005915 [Peltula sp. TS41687]|nr:MAG: hypothetical protein M1816_005915 [Peltula sp. TS41687]